ncbi:hypothetical protein MGYG_08768 [Nannizzia gypsea CBS 118893]|uniref:Uncharacterized protein n=1 Tax=Arthroderma gypseum (strain ATCC MYA-4604 / CBS 118893) TaxID=535722 RepID=E4V6Y1_ARTGP|nr:hypothetical protein MGYG_08768 [Nannizzia gypsea CBS 118893]EFQ96847.1 hypothetical protein MGYG_08768 [Nannizzia gypsea CBS 118893]
MATAKENRRVSNKTNEDDNEKKKKKKKKKRRKQKKATEAGGGEGEPSVETAEGKDSAERPRGDAISKTDGLRDGDVEAADETAMTSIRSRKRRGTAAGGQGTRAEYRLP